jgi:hypothetical protein
MYISANFSYPMGGVRCDTFDKTLKYIFYIRPNVINKGLSDNMIRSNFGPHIIQGSGKWNLSIGRAI